MIKIKVFNKKDVPVNRGNHTFLPGKEVIINCQKSQYREIKACRNLRVSFLFSDESDVVEVPVVIKPEKIKEKIETATKIENVDVKIKPIEKLDELTCEICGKSFKNKAGLNGHMRFKHKVV